MSFLLKRSLLERKQRKWRELSETKVLTINELKIIAKEANEMEYTRPSIIATVLWAFGLVIIGFTVWTLIFWRGWTENLQDELLVLVALGTGVNAIATGALIDMHTIKSKRQPT